MLKCPKYVLPPRIRIQHYHGLWLFHQLRTRFGQHATIFFIRIAVSSRSIIALARRLLERNYNKFDYVLTYRFSQDQIEMYFSKIRSRLGWNNNPTALQFKWALRTLLQKNLITAPTTGNCTNVTEKPEKRAGTRQENPAIARQFPSMA